MGIIRTGTENSYEERFGFKAKGSFNCRNQTEPILVAVVLAATVALWYVGLVFIVYPQDSALLYACALFLVSAVSFCIGGGAVRVVLAGSRFFYEADEKEFRIYKERGGKRILIETFYFVDVAGVKYQKMIPFRGYLVTVSTKYRQYKYQYLFRGARGTRDEEHCPFSILEQRRPADSEESEG